MRRVLIAFAALAISALSAVPAFADATPVQLVLTYMPDVSNTGTASASGIAELVLLEGEVRINAADLPHLDGSDHYVAWLVNSQSNQYLHVGAFNAAESGVVHYENVLEDAIPDKRWNLLLITVENAAEPELPSGKHSIAGVFPSSAREAPPQLLPNTGGLDDAQIVIPANRPEWLATAGLAALTLSVGLTAGYVLGKR